MKEVYKLKNNSKAQLIMSCALLLSSSFIFFVMNSLISVSRNDELDVVILEKDIILYQRSGYDDLDMFNDDLTSFDGDSRLDIMQVYRGYHDSPVSFISYQDEEILYTREEDDIKPTN